MSVLYVNNYYLDLAAIAVQILMQVDVPIPVLEGAFRLGASSPS